MLREERRKNRLQDLKDKLFAICGNEYSLLSTDYVNMRTKVKMRHNVCGTIFEVRPDAFFREKGYTRCPNKDCVRKRIEKTSMENLDIKTVYLLQMLEQKSKIL